jgi:siroheme synthase-like protein
MHYFPLFIAAEHINALVIGGGEVAARKIELLLKSTQQITVMSAQVNRTVERLIKTHQLVWLAHDYQMGFMQDKNIVIAATDNPTVNQHIAKEAKDNKAWVNVVDAPELCSYITPAIIDRSPMIVAITSSGSAPVLVRMLREQIEKIMPQGYGRLAEFCFKFRDHVKARIKGVSNRRRFWQQTLEGNIGQSILYGHEGNAEQQFIASLSKPQHRITGSITFIHTGDGNPDHLTLAAHRALQYAEAVFYDHQVNTDLLEYVRRDAEKYPQKIPATVLLNYQHAMELASQGIQVVYLLAGHHELPKNAALEQSGITTQEFVSGH